MTITRRVEEGLLVLDVGQRTSYDELEEHFSAGFADPAFDPEQGVLLLVNRTRFLPSLAEVRKASRFFVELVREKPTRFAFVTETAVHYGLGRILQAYCDHLEIALYVSKDQAAARAWLRS